MIDWGSMLAGDAAPAATSPAVSPAKLAAPELRTGKSVCAIILARERAGDDRRRCDECGNLASHGLCLAAYHREIKASRRFMPIQDMLQRCKGFAPLPGDPDRRRGKDKWPGLE
jgi:hypothetical protein